MSASRGDPQKFSSCATTPSQQGQSIREGRIALAVPGCLSDCLHALRHMLVRQVGEQRDHGQSQQRRGSPLDCSLGPIPLSFKSQASTYFLKGGLHPPASHKPGDDLLRVGTKIGAKERLGSELSFGVLDQLGRKGTAGKPVLCQTAVSDTVSTVRSSLPYQLVSVMAVQTVKKSSATTERVSNLSPLRRGFPL